MSDKPLVLYHSHCSDGFCSAWVAHKAIPDAEFVPVQHGQDPPEVAGRDLYILDFSYKRPVMLSLLAKARSLTLLDHHKTAQAELEGLELTITAQQARSPHIVFDMSKSGGRLTWEHFFPGQEAPWLVNYTEDRDLWMWKLPDSRAISAFLASHDFSFETWDILGDNPGNKLWDSFVEQGEAILRYQARQVKALCSNAREVEIGGFPVLAVNTPVLQSEVAGKLSEGRSFGAAWFVRADGKKTWSLRSRNESVDVSEVARKLGGGGHHNAAGFEEDP